MPLNQITVGPQVDSDGTVVTARAGKSGEAIAQFLHGRYYEQAYRKNIFAATGIVTAPVIYTTAAGTGGPLIWNGATAVNVVILAVSLAITTASAVAGSIGITGNNNQTVIPGSTTIIDSLTSGIIGAASPQSHAYRIGTPATAGAFFLPLISVETGANSTVPAFLALVDIGGSIICPPNSWVSVAASATLTSAVCQIGLIYEEVPV